MAIRRNGAWLLAVARIIAEDLKPEVGDTGLRIRVPSRVQARATDGWSAVIGHLDDEEVWLEVWYDRFSGYPDRKLYACFVATVPDTLLDVKKRLARTLWPVREVTDADTDDTGHFHLMTRLARGEFNAPILERYDTATTYFGIYDVTRESTERLPSGFRRRAVTFFSEVARALPAGKKATGKAEVYPRIENRTRVKRHLRRERNALLALDCKARDDYTCQVCGFIFEEVYGTLGAAFAESHHKVPLSRLDGETQTELRDLITVCANCHRMLHRMDGEAGDVAKLRRIVRRRQQ